MDITKYLSVPSAPSHAKACEWTTGGKKDGLRTRILKELSDPATLRKAGISYSNVKQRV